MTPHEYDLIRRKRWTKGDRDAVAAKTQHRCAYCGCALGARFALDHVVPLRKGGTDDVDNLVAACIQCNHRKATLTVEQFRAAIEDAPRQLERRSLTGRIAAAYGMLIPRRVIFYYEASAAKKDGGQP